MVDAPSISVLVVDDEESMRASIEQWLRLAEFEVAAFARAETALSRIDYHFPGILVCDVKMPDLDGMEVLHRLSALDPDLPVILITGHGDIAMAVTAMHRGAYDFIEKPFDPVRLVDAIRRACEKRRLTLENRRLREQVDGGGIEARLPGHSRAIERLRREVLELAATDVNVVVYGETGAGKEVVAHCLHDFSARRAARLVAINCAAIPETMFESEVFGHEPGAFTSAMKRRTGKIEYAHRGTLLLDEIEAMPLQFQVKILRVLEERVVERLGSNDPAPANVRTVAASKVHLPTAIDQGRFRADLYYRLGVAEIHVPPLRERGEDILLLFRHFASQAARAHGRELHPPDTAVQHALMAHHWPGNVRELRNAADRYALGVGPAPGSPATTADAPAHARPLAERVEAFEKRLIEQALEQSKGNVAIAMEHLGLPRRTLNEKMLKYGVDRARVATVAQSETKS